MTADEQAVAAAKRLLRNAVRLRRDARDPGQRAAADLARVEVLRRQLHDQPPPVVACYLSAGTEPGSLPLVGWLASQNVRVLLPVLTDKDGNSRAEPAWAHYAGPEALRVGRASILEPTGPVLPEAPADAELVLCPALAASPAGDRLGRGGGWYDRALADVLAPVWTLLNDDEVLDTIPTTSWDRPVDGIVTPTAFLECSDRSRRAPSPPGVAPDVT